LPDELFQLIQLHWLNLGEWYLDEDGQLQESASNIEPNSVAAIIGRLVDLAELRHLSLRNTELSDLAPLRSLTNLQMLDCAPTRVSDLTPLESLPSLQSSTAHLRR
jgi:Leucine-rich repeat (LRR) protein